MTALKNLVQWRFQVVLSILVGRTYAERTNGFNVANHIMISDIRVAIHNIELMYNAGAVII